MRILILLLALTAFSQSNTWTLAAGQEVGSIKSPALVYCPDSNRFILSMGNYTSRYSELMFTLARKAWINFLPSPSLYGVWADSLGDTRGAGTFSSDNFGGNPYFSFYAGAGYLRPNLNGISDPLAYNQFAYRPLDGKIYYFIANRTCTYDTRTRRWDTLSCAVSPAPAEGMLFSKLFWGAMCYDAVNDEILLFGGNNVNNNSGTPGTWIFNPTTHAWRKPSLSVEPPARALSPMVYDSVNRCIVLFGGDHLDHLLADTWVYDCASRTWTQKNPSRSPSPRGGHSFLCLPKSGKLVLFGGFTYTSSESYCDAQYAQIAPFQIWTYNPAADEWQCIKVFSGSDSVPHFLDGNAAFPIAAAADTGDRILALADDPETYEYGMLTWRLNCDPSQRNSSGTTTYGVAPGTITRRTGSFIPEWYDSAPPANTDSIAGVHANLPLSRWVKMAPPRAPRIDYIWGSRVMDTKNDQILVWAGGHSSHGGTDVPQYFIAEDRWRIGYDAEWPLECTHTNETYPAYFSFNKRPWIVGHTYDNQDYDPVLGKLVLIKHRYTYFYDAAHKNWDTVRSVNPSEMAFDFYANSVTSTPHGAFGWASTGYYSWGLFIMDSATLTWKALPLKGAGLPQYYCEEAGATYDLKRDRVILVSRSTDKNKVWFYDFEDSTLTSSTPSGTPPADNINLRSATYLPGADKVLFAGDLEHPLYNCAENSWETMTVAKSADVDVTNTETSGYLFDPKRGLVFDIERNCEVYVLKLASENVAADHFGAATRAAPTLTAAPNPFNPVTTIRYDLGPTPGATLAVYSADGRFVREWKIARQRGAVEWDASASASGVYFCRLITFNNRVLVHKIALIK